MSGLRRLRGHRAQHLDIADGIETEPFGDPCFYELDDPRYGGFRIVRSHEVEVAVWSGRAEIGDRVLVDTIGTNDDAAQRSLPERFDEAHDRQGAR
jgi:hypothetical protein